MGFSLQAHSKTLEGKQPVDRDAQFHDINEQTLAQLSENNPLISVDTKKKEIVGDDKNDGVELAPKPACSLAMSVWQLVKMMAKISRM